MSTPIRQVKGIGLFTEEALADEGLTSVESIAEATIEQLVSVPGFGPKRAEKVIENARQLIAELSSEENKEAPVAAASPSDVADKKEKKKKAKKGKNEKKDKPKDKKEKKVKKEKKQKKGKQKKGQEKKKGKKKKKK
jgi:transcription termination factor NusA